MTDPEIMEVIFWIILVVNVVAFWRLLPRAGLPPYVALLALIPPFSPFLFWYLAFRKWPEMAPNDRGS